MNHAEISKFITTMAKVYMQNPNLKITKGTIYHQLMIYNLSDSELRDNSLLDVFDNLKAYFAHSRIDVFVSPLQKRFLQMQNVNATSVSEKFIKIYMSFPKKSMEQCVKIIFDYIKENNIYSYSKIADEIRSDSVVLRLNCKEDALSVMNFVNSNSFLRNNAKLTNPFLLRYGICGVSYDDEMSYNSTISELMRDYFINLWKNNNLQGASLQNFYEFVNVSYQNRFINKTQLEELVEQKDYTNLENRFKSIGHKINNQRKIQKLLLVSLSNDFNIDAYFTLYDMDLC